MATRRTPAILRTGSFRFLALLAVVPLAAVLLVSCDPSSTLSPTHQKITYSAGPFAVANATGAAGDPVCNDDQLCSDHAFRVATPAGYGDTHQLRVSVTWSLAAADFDVYLLDASGAVISAAASQSDPEVLLAAPDTGDYTLRVVPYLPLGQSFDAELALIDKTVEPPPGTGTAPTYRSYASPESFPGAHDAGEPSIGVNWKTGAVMYQAGLDTARVTFADATSPATATWTDRSAGPPKCTSVTSLDPILYTDHATGRTFESQLAGKAALTCYSDDDGATWTPTSGSGINSGVDHQTVGGGQFHAGSPGALTSYPNAVYYCSQDIADASCAASRDGGLTYGPAVPMYSLLDCGGLHGHVKVAPDGTVYVPNKGCGSNQAVAVSEDNGLTWALRKVPGSTPADSDPSVGIGANGTIYFGYQNSDGHPRVAVSHDKGRTWQHDQDVGRPFATKNSVFPVVVAGDDNRAAFAYLGTPTGGNYQDTAGFKGVWHLYVATTLDGGASWVTADATPNDPVQRGSICTGGTTCGNDRNLLDFNDITIDRSGRVLVGIADGCTGSCVRSGPNTFDAKATIVRQTSGGRLFAAGSPKADLTLGTITATRSPTGSLRVTVPVRNIGGRPATGVRVRVSEGRTVLGTTAAVTLGPGEVRSVTVTGTTTAGSHTFSAVADPANTVAESNEANNRSRRTVAL